MKYKLRIIATSIGAGIGAALASTTHHPSVWLPLGIGVGLAVGVGLHDHKQAGREATVRSTSVAGN